MTFKTEMQDLFYELANIDPDLSTIAENVLHVKVGNKFRDVEDGRVKGFKSETLPKGFIVNINTNKNDWDDVQNGDIEFKLPAKGLLQDPAIGDYFITADEVSYKVINIKAYPADIGYSIQLRKTKYVDPTENN